jgi:hypothetical protein
LEIEYPERYWWHDNGEKFNGVGFVKYSSPNIVRVFKKGH